MNDVKDLHVIPVLNKVKHLRTQIVAGVKYHVTGEFSWLGKCSELAEEAPIMMASQVLSRRNKDHQLDDNSAATVISNTRADAIKAVCTSELIQLAEQSSEIELVIWYQAWATPACQSVTYEVVSGPSAVEAHDLLLLQLSSELSQAMLGDNCSNKPKSYASWVTELCILGIVMVAVSIMTVLFIVVVVRSRNYLRRSSVYNKEQPPLIMSGPYSSQANVTYMDLSDSQTEVHSKPLIA